MNEHDLDRARILMMKVLDHCNDAAELAEFERLLAQDRALQAEFLEMSHTCDHLEAFRTRTLNDLSTHAVERSSERVGVVTAALVGFGSLLMVGVMLWLLFTAPDLHIALKIGLGAVTAGALLAFVKIVIDRLRAAPHDAYTEVDR